MKTLRSSFSPNLANWNNNDLTIKIIKTKHNQKVRQIHQAIAADQQVEQSIMQALERDSDSDEEMVTSPTSPVTYRPSPYELLCNAKIEINRKYLESIGLEKAASELKKQALPSQKENKTAGKKSSLGNVEDAAVTPTRKTRPKRKCASTETAMVKKKRMMAKQRHERKKLWATARAAAKKDNNAKLDEELEKLARELEVPDIGINRQKS
ncbi:hypothetical protein ACA910_021504 [Epithemia clementina (nom. ined.)]